MAVPTRNPLASLRQALRGQRDLRERITEHHHLSPQWKSSQRCWHVQPRTWITEGSQGLPAAQQASSEIPSWARPGLPKFPSEERIYNSVRHPHFTDGATKVERGKGLRSLILERVLVCLPAIYFLSVGGHNTIRFSQLHFYGKITSDSKGSSLGIQTSPAHFPFSFLIY